MWQRCQRRWDRCHVRIPEHVREQVGAQARELAVLDLLVVALLVDPYRVVLYEIRYVPSQREEVREELVVIPVIRGVVPYIQVLRVISPGVEVGAERHVVRARGVIDLMSEAALDRAQPHDDVVARLYCRRRLPGVLIRECQYLHVGIVLFDLLRNAVDKGQHHARLPFPVREGAALLAGAVVPVVVLRHRNDADARIVGYTLPHVLQHGRVDVLVGETRLRRGRDVREACQGVGKAVDTVLYAVLAVEPEFASHV